MSLAGIDVIPTKSTPLILARLYNSSGNLLKQSDITSIKLTVYELREDMIELEGYTDIDVDKTSVISDTLITDNLWEKDNIGYNFKHFIPVSSNYPFNKRNELFLVEYLFQLTDGFRFCLLRRIKTL